jgi:hypothetical protein
LVAANAAFDFRAMLAPGKADIVFGLKIQPGLRR